MKPIAPCNWIAWLPTSSAVCATRALALHLDLREGELVESGTLVATVVSRALLYVEVGVPQRKLPSLEIGQEVEIRSEVETDLVGDPIGRDLHTADPVSEGLTVAHDPLLVPLGDNLLIVGEHSLDEAGVDGRGAHLERQLVFTQMNFHRLYFFGETDHLVQPRGAGNELPVRSEGQIDLPGDARQTVTIRSHHGE